MGLKRAKLMEEMKGLTKVCLDSSILIYHLEDMQPYSDLTETIFERIVEGIPKAILSTISITELLVQPFATGREDHVLAFENFLLTFPNISLIPPSYFIAKEGARLRARYGVRTPDALLLATALAEKSEAFLTNDARLKPLRAEGMAIIILDDFL